MIIQVSYVLVSDPHFFFKIWIYVQLKNISISIGITFIDVYDWSSVARLRRAVKVVRVNNT